MLTGRRIVAVHHRLTTQTGHRFHEALGFIAEARRRRFELVLLVHEEAEIAVRQLLPAARPVLHDPVFRTDMSFEERARDFVEMLHQHVDGEVRAGDVVLMTVATQCEVRAFAEWVCELPESRRPHLVLYFHSDRWNRYGADERARQIAEFDAARRSLAPLVTPNRPGGSRVFLGCSTPGLAKEISDLLGAPVEYAPIPLFYGNLATATGRARTSSDPTVGLLGGARPEKGFLGVRNLVEACRRQTRARFVIQMANEQLPLDAHADLLRLAAEPDVVAIQGGLSPEVYAQTLQGCDLLAMPYDRVSYRRRTSGVFCEAAAYGKPVVVPDGIWISALVACGVSAGVAYGGEGADAAADGIATALSRLPELQARARPLVAWWRRRMSLPAFLDWIEAGLRR